MSQPRLLDLFCGAGGAAMGYHLAGFEVVGVDMDPQPDYPFEFVRADVFNFLADLDYGVLAYQAIHASPPCQRYGRLNRGRWGNENDHPDLIGRTRHLLRSLGLPYVIENTPDAPLVEPIVLCGFMFGLRDDRGSLIRHRLFESNVKLTAPEHPKHEGPILGVYGHGGGSSRRGVSARADEARRIMGMPWATKRGCSLAIPPAYAECVGRQLITQL